MSDMLERIARNICASCGDDPDAMAYPPGPAILARKAHVIYVPTGQYQQPVPCWMLYRQEAYAALQALHDPTEAMLQAGPPEPYMDRDVWSKMIDGAIENASSF